MGSKACKARPDNFTDNVSIRQIPELTPEIQDFIFSKKPFEKQLEKQKKQLRKYPDGIYDGPIGFMNSPNGFGKIYKNNGSLYIGKFSNGQAQGQGVFLFPDGSFFQGNFQKNMFQKGQYSSKNLRYIGELKNNLFQGQGHLKNFKDRCQFQGVFHQGKIRLGTMKWNQKNLQYIYEGKFNDQEQFQNGGKLIQQPQGYYIGQYKNCKKHGNGTYYYKNGIKYTGQYYQGTKKGKGILYNGDGTISYQGIFQNGLPHGQGKAYDRAGNPVQTNWIEGIDQALVIL